MKRPSSKATLEWYAAELLQVLEGLNERESAAVLAVVHRLVAACTLPKRRR